MGLLFVIAEGKRLGLPVGHAIGERRSSDVFIDCLTRCMAVTAESKQMGLRHVHTEGVLRDARQLRRNASR